MTCKTSTTARQRTYVLHLLSTVSNITVLSWYLIVYTGHELEAPPIIVLFTSENHTLIDEHTIFIFALFECVF